MLGINNSQWLLGLCGVPVSGAQVDTASFFGLDPKLFSSILHTRLGELQFSDAIEPASILSSNVQKAAADTEAKVCSDQELPYPSSVDLISGKEGAENAQESICDVTVHEEDTATDDESSDHQQAGSFQTDVTIAQAVIPVPVPVHEFKPTPQVPETTVAIGNDTVSSPTTVEHHDQPSMGHAVSFQVQPETRNQKPETHFDVQPENTRSAIREAAPLMTDGIGRNPEVTTSSPRIADQPSGGDSPAASKPLSKQEASQSVSNSSAIQPNPELFANEATYQPVQPVQPSQASAEPGLSANIVNTNIDEPMLLDSPELSQSTNPRVDQVPTEVQSEIGINTNPTAGINNLSSDIRPDVLQSVATHVRTSVEQHPAIQPEVVETTQQSAEPALDSSNDNFVGTIIQPTLQTQSSKPAVDVLTNSQLDANDVEAAVSRPVATPQMNERNNESSLPQRDTQEINASETVRAQQEVRPFQIEAGAMRDIPGDPAPAAHPTGPELIEQIVRKAHIELASGRRELAVRLDPPELGQINVRVISDSGILTAHLEVSTPAVRELLQSNLDYLRQSLEKANIGIGQCMVSLSSGQENHDANRQDMAASLATRRLQSVFATGNEVTMPSLEIARHTRRDGLTLDYFA